MEFCSSFDESLAHHGPAAVFLPDTEGRWRFQPSWTRDVWGRNEADHALGWTWTLLRDRDSGFVMLALITAPTLVTEHPRLDIRTYATLEEAKAARSEYGNPPRCEEPW